MSQCNTVPHTFSDALCERPETRVIEGALSFRHSFRLRLCGEALRHYSRPLKYSVVLFVEMIVELLNASRKGKSLTGEKILLKM